MVIFGKYPVPAKYVTEGIIGDLSLLAILFVSIGSTKATFSDTGELFDAGEQLWLIKYYSVFLYSI